jgi:Sigma-70, region 4
MPAHRMSMRKLKEVLRLKWVCGLSHRQISRAVGISVGAVSAYAARNANTKSTSQPTNFAYSDTISFP